jgi:hypothetical protein
MSTVYPASWNEPSAEVVDRLTRWGCFAADTAVIEGNRHWTPAQQTEAAVRAALRMLLANGVIKALLPSDTEDVYIAIDPPVGMTGR